MKKLLLLGILIYIPFFLGLVTMKVGLPALAIPLVVYLGAALLYRPEEPRLKVTRTLSTESASRGAPVTISLSITNEGSDLEEILVEDRLPPFIEVTEGEPRVLTALPAGETAEITYTVRGKRGSFEFRDVRVTAGDHLGIFQHRVSIAAPGRFFILPQIVKVRQVAIRPLRTRAYAGPIPARQGGSGISFFGVREYQPGDPPRWINWRMGARHPHTLFSNEFEQERVADVGLILDARRRTDMRRGGESLFEHAVDATASLAAAFLSEGNRVGLLVYGWFMNWTFPGYGRVQRKRILEALAQAKTGDSMVFTSFDHLPTRFFPAKSQLVLVSPLCHDDLPMLIRLRARGYQLIVVSPDPVSFEAKGLGTQPSVELAARIAHLERTLMLRQLRRVGIQTVDWSVDRPFDQVVHASLSRTPHWLRGVGVEL